MYNKRFMRHILNTENSIWINVFFTRASFSFFYLLQDDTLRISTNWSAGSCSWSDIITRPTILFPGSNLRYWKREEQREGGGAVTQRFDYLFLTFCIFAGVAIIVWLYIRLVIGSHTGLGLRVQIDIPNCFLSCFQDSGLDLNRFRYTWANTFVGGPSWQVLLWKFLRFHFNFQNDRCATWYRTL